MMGKNRSNRNKVSKTKLDSFKSKFLNPNKNKRSYSVKDIEKIFPASRVVTHDSGLQEEWYAWNDPNMTQEQYMEQYNISYEKNAQTKLWFGEEWARKSIPWDYHNQSHLTPDIDNISSTTVTTAPITDSLEALRDTVSSLNISDGVTEEEIADLKSRVTVLEAKLDLMDKALQDIIDN
jgi:hypothetical protein